MLAQLHGSVAILNLRGSVMAPTPEDLADVPSETTVIVKASTNSDYSNFELEKVRSR